MTLLALRGHMESWEVVVIGGNSAALRAAISASDGGASTLLIDSAGIGSRQGDPPYAGLAASLGEIDSSAHRDDTISAGGEKTNKISAANFCGQAVSIVAELERWGLIFRRDDDGLPHRSWAPGHNKARLTGSGDSTVREITRILEEQTIKRKITRRYDCQVLSIVSDNQQVRGLIYLDIISGEVNSIQAKSIILATEGYEGLWQTPGVGSGTGLALAIRSEIPLQGINNFPIHPLTIKGTNMHLPMDILDSGAQLRKPNGDDAQPSDVLEESCVLDLRKINEEDKPWYKNTLLNIKNRTNLDINADVIPISPSVITTGGIPVDPNGRVTINEGKLWFTGLYAAGQSSNNGMHGNGLLPGNLLLHALLSGKIAGLSASSWALKENFSNSSLIESEEQKSLNVLNKTHKPEGKTVGQISTILNSIANDLINNPNETTGITKSLKKLQESGIRMTDTSKTMNTELLMAMQIQNLILILEKILLE
tara:strand:+ start:17840 stop:19285 length:1446 start_codon:yes stop_codon:yes gene_type:complete